MNMREGSRNTSGNSTSTRVRPVIRQAGPEDRSRVEAFYRAWNYSNQVTGNATVFLAELEDNLIGLVRLEPEHGMMVLRGMRVEASHQRQGVGTALLRAVAEHLGTDPCYCVPYSHLATFYEQIGFVELAPQAAPVFLRTRLTDYRARGLDVIVMTRPGTPAAVA